jgi:Domain of unknown function (DUF4336)
MPCLKPYEPINTLTPVADDIWIVDGPIIQFGFLGLHVPFPTRMTIVRLPGGMLWVHSPTLPAEPLLDAIATLDAVTFLVAPSKLHYWWIGEWKLRFPGATTYAAPAVRKYARQRVASFDRDLGDEAPTDLGGTIGQVIVPGALVTEVDFFHRASRTLILTDLIENFEPERIACWHIKLLMKVGGLCDPDGKTPFDMRMSQLQQKPIVRAAVKQMLAWQPKRIILAHGRWYKDNAEAELRRAFRWVLR